MNRTQVSIYHLGAAAPAMPDDSSFTDVTESTLFVALFGPKTFLVAEKLTNLDFLAPSRQAPFLLQGPFCHVPCQIVTLEKSAGSGGGFLLTCSRGYATAWSTPSSKRAPSSACNRLAKIALTRGFKVSRDKGMAASAQREMASIDTPDRPDSITVKDAV
jgi:hypothetical protein